MMSVYLLLQVVKLIKTGDDQPVTAAIGVGANVVSIFVIAGS